MMTRSSQESVEGRVAYFVSPHGYGHAARASAVMGAAHEINPKIHFEIFTQVPRWFFQDSLYGPFGYHSLLSDIGLAQKTALVEDIPETLKRLDSFLPFEASQIRRLAEQLNQLQCQLAICDIAPIGIAVARKAGAPSVLVENFTWDWIYEEYAKDATGLRRHIAYLRELFEAANYRVQTEPACQRARADLSTAPVSRKPRSSPQRIRRQLGIPGQAKVVMITMGGIPWQYDFVEHLANQTDFYLIIPGVNGQAQVRDNSTTGSDRLVLLPRHSDYFHPDLVNASDVVIGKAGYSTVAEAYYAGVPFGYVIRPRFRESQILESYIQQEMNGLPIAETQFQDGSWLSSAVDLMALPRIHRRGPHGADQVAGFICELLDRKR